MAITPTKTLIKKLAEVLEQPYDSAEEAAEAALSAAWDMYEARARFAVVGQVDDGQKPPTGDKVCLGLFATEKQALDAALALTYSTATHETAHAWVLAAHHGTAHSWYSERKTKQKIADLQDGSFRERELQRREQWVADNPGKPVPKEWHLTPYESQVKPCPECMGLGQVREHGEAKEDAA